MGDVSIVGVGAALPELRLPAADVAAAWGRGGGRGQVAVCAADEDPLTLAWTAAVDALDAAGLAPGDVDGLWWGTTRAPFAEGPSWVHLAATLRLGDHAAGALLTGSTLAGRDALTAACDAVASGAAANALVIVSEALRPGPGTALETAGGAGAVAVVLRPDAGPARLAHRVHAWQPALDRYRGDLESDTRDVYDGRLFREEVFLPLGIEAVRRLGVDPGSTRWSLPDPDGRLGSALARKVGATAVVSAEVRKAVGDLGAAAFLAGAVPALLEPGPVATLAIGDGRAAGFVLDVTAPVPGAERAAAALAAPGRPTTYASVLRSRAQLVPNGERVEMAVPPGSAMFVRDNEAILGLIGGRCIDCATVAFPPSVHPTCLTCGGDKFDPAPLGRTGTVQTFVVNQTMPAPFVAPLPLVCVDLDDGTRVMFQGIGDGTDLAIGGPVELVLRRYTVERGVPVYGWKVRTR